MSFSIIDPHTGARLAVRVEGAAVERGRFAPSRQADVLKAMPRICGLPASACQYVFGDGKFCRGDYVAYAGARWRVYDADAQGGGFTLFLVSKDASEFVRGVEHSEVVPEHRRK